MALSRLERNQIFEAIAANDLDPAEFTLREVKAGLILIRHLSGSEFKFANAAGSPEQYIVSAMVADGTDETYYVPRKIADLIRPIRAWVNEIKQVSETPDLWAEMLRSRELITEIQQTDSDNTPFTQDEQRQIAAQLQEIKKQVREQFELTNEQIEQIDARLDEAEDASKRIGRKDWLLLFGGTILNLIATDTMRLMRKSP
jgi:hypothetical protein